MYVIFNQLCPSFWQEMHDYSNKPVYVDVAVDEKLSTVYDCQ